MQCEYFQTKVARSSLKVLILQVWSHDFEYRMKTDEDARTSMQNVGFFKWVGKESKEQTARQTCRTDF